jgi:hypothetical protein
MSSSFYPATTYYEQDQKLMIYELDKENFILKKKVDRLNKVIDMYREELHKLEEQLK